MTDALRFKMALSAVFGALYVGLFWVTVQLGDAMVFGGFVSLLFLPAFVRLVAVLVVGAWATPLLFFAGYLCILFGWYDIAPGRGAEIAATLAMSIGAPLGIWLTMKGRRVRPDLKLLSPWDLFWLSVGGSFGNALLQTFALHAMLPKPPDDLLMLGIFFGDTLGTWCAIMLVKAGLTLLARR